MDWSAANDLILPVGRKIERWFRPDEGESGSSRLRALGDQTPLIVNSESVPYGLSEIPRMVGGPALSLFYIIGLAIMGG